MHRHDLATPRFIFLLVLLGLLLSGPAAHATQYPSIREQILTEPAVDPAHYHIKNEVVVFDLWKYFKQAGIQDVHEQADVVYLLTSLQGIVNREQPRLYLFAALTLFDIETHIKSNPNTKTIPVSELDAFWWTELERKGYFTSVRRSSDLAELIRYFRADVAGLTLWEMDVPATANAALMAAGCENLLPVSRDLGGGRLRQWLTKQFPDLAVKLDLTAQFTGRTPIKVGDRIFPSTGSAKNDVYRFAIEKYLKGGSINPNYLWYNCDAAMWGKLRNVYSPGAYGHLGSRAELQHNGMYNIDYWVAQRAFMLDLQPWGDVTPNDDPNQPLGTDLATWNDILQVAYQRRGGEFGVLGGFVPWWIKYTDTVGGKHAGVPTEWEFIALATSYNLVNEGDAAFGIANASFFMHLPQVTPQETKTPPTPELAYKNGTTYVAFCMMDYDGSAWVNQMVPPVYNDPERGKVPLNWCINPIINRRIPQAMRYLYEHRTAMDFFGIACDGVGYFDPLALSERRGRVKESGIAAYERFATTMNQRYGYDITAYYISPRFTAPWIEMAARLDKGFGYNVPMPDRLVNGTPATYLSFFHVLEQDKIEAELRQVFQSAAGSKDFSPSFKAYRCVLVTPGMIVRTLAKLRREFPEARVEVTDLRNYYRLLKRKLGQPLISPYRDAPELSAAPGHSQGITATPAAGGYFETQTIAGQATWVSRQQQYGLYIYFDVDDAFTQRTAGQPMELVVTYLDQGTGKLELQYDSQDPAAPLEGAYKNAQPALTLQNSGQWRTVTFRLPDARFSNRQNSATDLRFFKAANDRLVIRSLKVRPAVR